MKAEYDDRMELSLTKEDREVSPFKHVLAKPNLKNSALFQPVSTVSLCAAQCIHGPDTSDIGCLPCGCRLPCPFKPVEMNTKTQP